MEALKTLAENGGVEWPALTSELQDPDLVAKLVAQEEEMLALYRRHAHSFPAATRLEGDEARRIRDEVIEGRAEGRSFAGCDLTGADLSQAPFRITCDSDDDQSHVRVDAFAADFLPKEAIFATVEEATTFLQPATSTYTSATPKGELEGMEIVPKSWPIRAMALWEATSSVFEHAFAIDSLAVDCAMLLRNVEYEWTTTTLNESQRAAL